MKPAGSPRNAAAALGLVLFLAAIGLAPGGKSNAGDGSVSSSRSAPRATTSSPTPIPYITTVAGSGRKLLGVGGPATQVNLGELEGLAFDSKGNLYVSDQSNHVVVKITPSGLTTVFAGNGAPRFSGDGGPANQAGLTRPGPLAFDASGNLYIGDRLNFRIRKVTPGGTISTYAGGGTQGNNGDPPEGISALDTNISEPNGIAVDSAGNVYTSDVSHLRVRKIRTDGTIVTVIGNGIAGFSGDEGPATSASMMWPGRLLVGSDGSLYMSDEHGHRIRKVTPDGIIHTIAGTGQNGLSGDGGPALQANLDQPAGLFMDAGGNLYVASQSTNVVRKISTDGTINTIIGNGAYGFLGDGGPATSAQLKSPLSIVLDSQGNAYVSDRFNNRVRRIDTSGTISTFAGNGTGNSFGDGGPATSSGLNRPSAVAFDSNGNMYIADTLNHKVRKVAPEGIISTVAGTGVPGFSGDGGLAVNASLNEPGGVATDSAGNVYVADTRNFRVRKIDLNGAITTFAGNGHAGYGGNPNIGDGGPAVDATLGNNLGGLATDKNNNLYIADGQNFRVRKVDPVGVITTIAGDGQLASTGDGGPATSASVAAQWVSVDTDGNIYVSDTDHWFVRKISPQGVISRVAGDGRAGDPGTRGCICLDNPPTSALAVSIEGPMAFPDGVGGFYVSSAFNQVIRVTGGFVSFVVQGIVDPGFGGDDGPALTAFLYGPMSISRDAAGDLYIADTVNDRIRKVWFHPPTFQPLNIATRMRVLTGEKVLIAGFIITGTEPKKVILRGIAPSIGGVGGTVSDPTLELHQGSTTIGANDNWKFRPDGTSQQAEIEATTIPPSNDLESALVATLSPGAYTAVLAGKNNETGIGLVELYDLAQPAKARLANISTRGFVDTGDNVMIGGFIVGGIQGIAPAKIVARAIGPSLGAFGVQGALSDPTLELHDGNGATLATNDNWKLRADGSSQQAEIEATTLPPGNDLESALVQSVPPGNYTAVVRGKNNTTGIGLVEVYNLQ